MTDSSDAPAPKGPASPSESEPTPGSMAPASARRRSRTPVPAPIAPSIPPPSVTPPAVSPSVQPPGPASQPVAQPSSAPPASAPAPSAGPAAGPSADPHAKTPLLARPSRGLGLITGLLSFVVAGVADGFVALVKAPRGSVSLLHFPLVVLHCIAVVGTLGLVVGVAQELLFTSGRQVPFIARLGAWFAQGPRRWFARDPDGALGLTLAIVTVCLVIGPIFPASYQVIHTFHSHLLAALAITLMVGGLIAAGLVVSTLIAAPLRWLFLRARGAASPGVVVCVGLAALGVYLPRFVWLHWRTLRNLDGAVLVVALAALLADLVALLVLGNYTQRRAKPLPPRGIAVAALVALVAFGTSAATFGARQTVAGVIFTRSLVTGYVARGLQLALDFDRDGYSSVFGGGDCNDRNANIHPGARDLPGNGVDENCSGRDAVVDRQESDGHMAPLPADFPAAPPSFVFLSVDAMRPDHMGVYGYRRRTTPHIDLFAREAARFTNAYCASPRSLRSFSSIWTGRYPSLIEWGVAHHYPPLSESNLTLAEQLSAAGYATAAFSGAQYFSRTPGFYQGFDGQVEGDSFKSDGAPVVARLRDWLHARELDNKPFFTWLHLMEPHDPYEDRTSPIDFGHAQVDQYDEDIARADELLAPLLDELTAMSTRRPLVVVIFGDHGEAFGEHGVFHHSFDLHDEALRVPLLIRGPGITPGPRDALTSLFDLNPTVLNLTRRPAGAPVSGRSLVPALYRTLGAGLTPRGWRDRLFSEVTPDGQFPFEIKALYAPPYKMLYDLRRGTWELFDIGADPRETNNLYDQRPDLAAPLRENLLAWIEGAALASNRTADVVQAALLRAPPQAELTINARFGDAFELLGVDVPVRRVALNGEFRATFYYRVLRRTRAPLLMDVHFVNDADAEPNYTYFRAPHYPLAGRYPTTEWNPGEIIRDEVHLHVDPVVEARPYRLRFSAITESDRVRLPVTGAPAGTLVNDAIELGPLVITR